MQPKDFKNHIVYLYYFNNHNRSCQVIVEIKYCNNLNGDTHSRDQKSRQKQKVSSKIFAIPVTLSTVACTEAHADMLKITSN